MAAVIPLTSGPLPAGARTEHRGLTYWMDRVLKELEKVRKAPDADAVHDLRVALRRCRSLAAVIEEVDAHPAWEELRSAGRKLFRSVGELRDVQVQQEWVNKFSAEGDALGTELRVRLKNAEERLRESSLRKAGKFDEKQWKRLARTLNRRVQLVPPGSPAAECLALERLEDAKELHRRALRTERPKPWHKLRIGVKRFRYAVEGLLPEHYALWEESLKRVQDLLGDVHDLDVLLENVREVTARITSDGSGEWEERIEQERASRIEAYRQLALGATSLWNHWRLGLPSNGKLEEAATARLRAMARACDGHRRRTAQTARLARAVYESLRRAGCGPVFTEEKAHRVFEASAILHGIQPPHFSGPQEKTARKYLRALPAPAGWTVEDWELAGMAIRYHRGKEPKNEGGRLGRLSEGEKKKILSLAGILRIARGLAKVGVTRSSGIRAVDSPEAVTIRVPELPDSPEAAAKLASAKHLLERGLSKPIVFRVAESTKKVLVIPARQTAEEMAVASD